MSGSLNERAKLARLFGARLTPMAGLIGRLQSQMTPEILAAIRQIITEHERELADLKEHLDGYDETRDRLRITQNCLVVALRRMGGSMDLYAGELNDIPLGSVVKVDKLEAGEGDSVPLRISWRPPNPEKPATTDIRG